jgi:hypothetical protein
MTDIFNVESEILRIRRANLLKGQREIVILGDGRGTSESNLYDGVHRLWVRWAGSANENGNDGIGTAFSVLAGSANYLCEMNQQVYIQWRGGDYEIVGPDPVHMAATGRGMTLLNPHNPRNNFMTQSQMLTALSGPVGGMLVNMQAWVVVLDDGTYIEYVGSSADAGAVSQHQDLTPYVPATLDEHRYAVLVFNVSEYLANAEPLQIVTSTPIDIATDLTPDDIAEALATMADTTCKPIWAYRLEYGQTVIRRHRFDRDLRGGIPGPLAIPDDFITGNMIAAGAVGTTELADSALTLPKAAATWLHTATSAPTTGDDSGDGYAIGTRWIDTATDKEYVCTDATVGAAVWVETTSVGTGTVTSVDIASTSGKITHTGGPITTSGAIDLGIAVDAITATEIAAGAVGNTELAADAVTQSKMADASVGTAELVDANVTTAKIADLAVTLAKMANGTPRKYIGFDNTGAAAELDAVILVPSTWGESMVASPQRPIAVYLNETDGKWYRIDLSTTPKALAAKCGFTFDLGTGAINTTGTVILRGLVGGFTGGAALSPHLPVWASPASAGVVTTTDPGASTGTQSSYKEMGWSYTANIVMVNPQRARYYLANTLANNATLTISHHADAGNRRRDLAAWVTRSDPVLSETYASSNQDADVFLKHLDAVTVDASGSTRATLGDAAGTDYRIAQGWTPSVTGTLISFVLAASTTSGSPAGTVNWSMQSNNAGSGNIPSGTVIDSGTITWVASSFITVTVASGHSYTAGTTYHLVIEMSQMQSLNVSYGVSINGAGAYGSGSFKWDLTTGVSFPNTWAGGGGTNDLRVVINTAAYDRISQGFQVGPSSQGLYSVKLWLKKVGTPTGNLTASIYTNTGSFPGSPSSLVSNGASSAVAASTLSTSYGWTEFLFPVRPVVSSGTQYHIVLSTADSASASNYVVWGVDTSSPSYSGGGLKADLAGTWTATPVADACFEVWKYDTAYDEQVILGRWSAGTRDMAVRYDSGAGANSDTNTTFKNVSGASIDVTCRVVLD